MKKTIFNAKRAVMTLIAILAIGSAQVWALSGYETIIWSEQGLDDKEAVNTKGYYAIGSYFQVQLTQGSGASSPTYYTAQSGLRCVAPKGSSTGNLITISQTTAGSTAGYRIIKIIYNATHNYKGATQFSYSGSPTSSNATTAIYAYSSNVTTASARVTETGNSEAGQLHLHSITVYYSDEEIDDDSPAIEVLNSSSIPIASYDFGEVVTSSGNVTLTVNGKCLAELYNQGYIMMASIDEGSTNFSVNVNSLTSLTNNTIVVSYTANSNATFEGNLNVWGFIASGCDGYVHGGEYVSIDIPLSVTRTAACSAPTVGAVTVTQPTSESTNTKLTFACPTGVTNTGGCDITEHGYVYSTTNTMPTIGGSNCTKFKRGDGISANTAYSTYGPTSLTCGTTYYVRAYAINAAGTAYGAVGNNTTHPCFVDHFIDDVHSTTGYTGDGMAKEGDYSASIPTIADKTERSDGNCEQRHYHFVGWVTAANKENPTGNIVVLTGTATGTTYYAVWAQESSH